MGVHRSGTTWLQQLLADTGYFDYVTAYHVIRYDQLPALPHVPSGAAAYQELDHTFARLGVADRVMDEVKPSAGLPEEYGFILDNHGCGNAISRANLPVFLEICRKIRTTDGPRPVLLKNPWDAASFLLVKELLPDARFVFIHRDPRRVISSALSGGRALLRERSAYAAMLSRRYERMFSGDPLGRARLGMYRLLLGEKLGQKLGLGVRYVTRRVAAANAYYVRSVGRLPASDHISIRYEDLCERPGEILGRVLEFLRVDPSRASAIRTEARPRRGDVLAEVKRYSRAIAQKNAAYMAIWGYE
jgi:Sulfotransferase family